MIDDLEKKYSVGALLYSPALNNTVADSVINEKFNRPYSLALCLEDTIADRSVTKAEQQAIETISAISAASLEKDFYLPKIFIRVRNALQIKRLYSEAEEAAKIITGFIFPKYTVTNASSYNDSITRINENSDHMVYMMPILESSDIIDCTSRFSVLSEIKRQTDSVKKYVLNVRVGGNDFCNQLGLRRHSYETIYDIRPVSQVLSDILTVFSRDYVVSGPVWEYFAGDGWETGLKREAALDRLNGFVGKTVIHPSQISIVNESLKVTEEDLADAEQILGWDEETQVSKSANGERMNEVRTHTNWAVKTVALARIYGVKE